MDTGFTGYLTLPAETVQQLGLTLVGTRSFESADGELFELEAYLAEVSWSGRLTDALVLMSDGAPRLGMTMLWGSRVTLDAVGQGEVRIEALEGGASGDKPSIMKRLLVLMWGWVKGSLFVIASSIVVTLGIIAFAFGVISLPLNFGEILTFMGIWLALGVIFGQNKPPAMSLRQYIPRRIRGIVCCYGFLTVIALVYVLRDKGAAAEITGQEVWGLLVLSVVSFAAGFLAGQDKEPKQQ